MEDKRQKLENLIYTLEGMLDASYRVSKELRCVFEELCNQDEAVSRGITVRIQMLLDTLKFELQSLG